MTEDLKNWYSAAVTRLYAGRGAWDLPELSPAVQLALLPLRPCPVRPLFIQRQREARLWAELRSFTEAAFERAFAFSVHRRWIEEVLDLLGAAPCDFQRYRYEAQRLRDMDDLAHLYPSEFEDIYEIARRLRNYSRALHCLALAEAGRLS